MKKELDEALCRDFPVLYRERNESMRVTCLCWGFPGDGWHTLIRELSATIENIVHNARNHAIYEYKKTKNLDYSVTLSPEILKELNIDEMGVVATQVKEKFGTLRFYYSANHLNERAYGEVSGAVEFAEAMSAHICEDCGNPGLTNSNGWLSTRCESCRSIADAKYIKDCTT